MDIMFIMRVYPDKNIIKDCDSAQIMIKNFCMENKITRFDQELLLQ